MQSGILPKVNTSICSSIWRVLSGSGLRNSKTLLPCRGKFLSRNSGLSCSLPYSTLWIPDTARYNFSPLHKGKSMAASSSTPVFGDVYVDDLISSCGNSLDFTKPTAVYFHDRRQSSFLKASPMLMLGISIGVAFNVMFANWMVTVLPIILFLGTAAKALMKGVETWKKKTMMKKEAEKQLESESKPGDGSGEDYKPLPGGPASLQDEQVPISHNVYWKELSMLVYVWVAFLIVQIVKTYIETCSTVFWVLNSLQIPIAVSVTLFEAICLCKGTRVIAGKEITNWKLHQIFLYCSCGIVAGMVGGLLGLGGGFILGPLFHELGIPPQVASATSTFAMLFSSSMSVVQYYLPN